MIKTRRPIMHPTDPSLMLVPLTRGHFAIISAVDAIDVGQFKWFAGGREPAIYAARTRSREELKSGGAFTEYLHQRIAVRMGMTAAIEVDHRNSVSLDCRRSNLRPATQGQNRMNVGLSGANSSGVKGVSWDDARRKWYAEIQARGRRYRLGRYSTLDEAAQAVADARSRLHGEFANHGKQETLQ